MQESDCIHGGNIKKRRRSSPNSETPPRTRRIDSSMDSQQQQQQQQPPASKTGASHPPSSSTNSDRDMLPPIFRPPVNRAMRVLDRSFFRKTIPLSAATVFENSNISRVRSELAKSHDLLTLPRLNIIRPAPASAPAGQPAEGKKSSDSTRKCLILREGIKHDGWCSAWWWI